MLVPRWLGLLVFTVILAAQPADATRAANFCPGDCDGDGAVTVDEILRGVALALGAPDSDPCPSFDRDADGEVTVDEILQAVNAALLGCPPLPSMTPTPEPSPTAAPPASPTASSAPDPTQSPSPSPTDAVTPSATPSTSATPIPTSTQSPSPAATLEPSTTPVSPSQTSTPIATASSTRAATSTPVGTQVASPTVTATASASPASTPTPSSTPSASSTASSTATPSATSSATRTATPTQTAPNPALVAQRVVAALSLSTDIFLAIPELLTTLARVPEFTAAGIPFELPCPAGGTFAASCTQEPNGMPPVPGPAQHRMTFQDCAANSGGRTLTLVGGIELLGTPDATCSLPGSSFAIGVGRLAFTTNDDVTESSVVLEDLAGTLDIGATAGLCGPADMAAQISGSITAGTVVQEQLLAIAQATFANTRFAIAQDEFDPQCLPHRSEIVVVGPISFDGFGDSAAIAFEDYRLDLRREAGSSTLSIAGALSSPCLGGHSSVSTVAPLGLADGLDCPAGGTLDLALPFADVRVSFVEGALRIDTNLDGQADATFPTCRETSALSCQP